MALFPRQIDILQRGLEAASLRQAALAHNLANVNTPGFKAQAVSFEGVLQQALEQGAQPPAAMPLTVTSPRHFQVGRPGPALDPARLQATVHQDDSRSARADGNNVDLEAEMAKVAGNQVWYTALGRQVTDEFTRLRLAITEGRR